jgi:hypothetical protein
MIFLCCLANTINDIDRANLAAISRAGTAH